MLIVDPMLFSLFVLAVFILVLTPGPVVSLIIAETLNESPKHGFAVVLGAGIVAVAMLALYMMGFSAIIVLLSDDILTAIRYLGAIYLIYLAIKSFRSTPDTPNAVALKVERTPIKAFRSAMLVAATNPKAILFFAAFFPQFVSPDLPAMPQLLALSTTFALLAPILDSCWVLAASAARPFLARQGSIHLIGRVSGTILALGAVCLLFFNK
ncbi:LysE family translocator [Kordiimonas aestuarii]|uniref:LysE family translocator n=1 Tax=Kordiimonas aestuarii TaxID=1005925 RepID=UPI0021D3059B|nr:LysE family translocator [Kordiimonas aestuarii]